MYEAAFAVQAFVGEELTVTEFLVLPRVGRYGRVPIHVDPLQARLAQGTWQPPQADTEVTAADGKSVKWSSTTANGEGWLEGEALRGGYAYAQVTSAERQVALLEATGHAMVFVNGEPRAGDPYLTGRTVLPILLKPGTNELLFHAAAGKLHARLSRPTHDVLLDPRDLTVPTLIRGETEPVWLGVLIINARDRALIDAQVTTKAEGGDKLTAKADAVPPLGVRKVAIPLLPPKWDAVAADAKEVDITISLDAGGEPISLAVKLAIADANEVQTRTFRSAIDGSVQEYRLLPAKANENQADDGMLVTLHDAGETATAHLAKFSSSGGRASACA